MVLFYKKLSSLFSLTTIRLSSRLQSSATAIQSHFMVDYLISSIGFPPHSAIKASKLLQHLRTHHQPDSVVRFLKQTGLSNTQIKTLISWNPKLLCADPERTLLPRAKELEEEGFSGPLILRLIRSNPFLLTRPDVLPRLRFWRSFFCGEEKDLLRAFSRNRNLVNYDISGRIMLNISLLHNYGLSDRDIAMVMIRANGFILRRPDSVRALIERTREWGVPCDSGMFVQVLAVGAMLKGSTLEKKMEFFKKTFGWSGDEVISAYKKHPTILGLSEKKIRSKMDFLVEGAGYDPSYIALHPGILTFSLDKRLVPRHCVLRILKSKELRKKDPDFFSVLCLSEKSFVEKFVLSFKNEVPDLHETYIAACTGRVLV